MMVLGVVDDDLYLMVAVPVHAAALVCRAVLNWVLTAPPNVPDVA